VKFTCAFLCLTAILLVPDNAQAAGEAAEKVREALDYLGQQECPIEDSQKLNYFCKAVTNKDLKELVNCAQKNQPCSEIASDLSSITTNINGNSYTLSMDFQSLLCGEQNFSFIPSDGCISDKNMIDIQKASEEIVDILANTLASCLDTKRLFDVRPFCVRRWNSALAGDNPFKKLKEELALKIMNTPRCDTKCQDGKDSAGFVTEECCEEKGWIYTVKDDRSYCCPPGKGKNNKCPQDITPTDKCISSCRIGTEEIDGKCCKQEMIANTPDGKKCCPDNTPPSVYNETSSFAICCSPGTIAIAEESDCCPIENVIETDEEKICCPKEKVANEEDNSMAKKTCCSDDQIVARGYEYGYNICCQADNVIVDKDGKNWCCPEDKPNSNGHCCPIDSIWIDD